MPLKFEKPLFFLVVKFLFRIIFYRIIALDNLVSKIEKSFGKIPIFVLQSVYLRLHKVMFFILLKSYNHYLLFILKYFYELHSGYIFY